MQRLAPHDATGRSRTARRVAALFLSGLVFTVVPPVPLTAQAPAADVLPPGDPIDAHVDEAARRFGIPAAWIRAVMRIESAGDRRAVSPKGAMGLMQIMPATWEELAARHRLGGDPFDPRDNVLAGAAYLRELHDRYGSPGFLAAYNAGPSRYEASLGGRPLPAETLRYVAALVPAIDGDAAACAVRVAAIDPFAWRAAPLFVARPADAGASAAAPSGNGSCDPSGAATGTREGDGPTAEPQRDSLFVARSRAEETP